MDPGRCRHRQSWLADAELVALRIAQHDPRHVPLANVDLPGAQLLGPGHQPGLVLGRAGREVQMDAVAPLLGLVDAPEFQRDLAAVGLRRGRGGAIGRIGAGRVGAGRVGVAG